MGESTRGGTEEEREAGEGALGASTQRRRERSRVN
jgi:hypothetical protein